MKEIEEIGFCPKCDGTISMYKTKNYKRFAKCSVCDVSYPLPKRGGISESTLQCPKSKYPILVITKKNCKAYFWTNRPCFTCTKQTNCEPIKTLKEEFKSLEVHGY